MSRYALHCRVCEEVAPPDPVEACVRCDGPTDVLYDWGSIRDRTSRERIAAGPRSLWRYAPFLPGAARLDLGAGWTPLVHARRLSDLLGVELHLKLESANPTLSFKDRMATVAAQVALDHGITTLSCSSTGNLGDAVAAAAAAAGLEAIVLAPAGDASVGSTAVAAGARVFAVRGTYEDCRRLQRELRELFPWGFVDGNLHPYAAEGAKTIAYEIAEQLDWRLPDAIVCPAASGILFAKLAQGVAELRLAGLVRGPGPRLFAAQPEGASPIAAAYAEGRGISRVRPRTHVRSLAVGDPSYGDLAIGAARSSGGDVVAVPESEVDRDTALLAETTGVLADCAGGVALGALLDRLAAGAIPPGSRVVLVVTGAGVKPHDADTAAAPVVVDADLAGLLRHIRP
ncbi:MAG TPA: threonine synthase [Gaiellaceae bacterium]|nr:threonine synthase [Gaiellaceae bacterium]